VGSKLNRMPGRETRLDGTAMAGGWLTPAPATAPVPFLFPGGEDEIFRDPFADFTPSRR